MPIGSMPSRVCKRILGGLFFAGLGLASTVVPLVGRAAAQPPLIPREVLLEIRKSSVFRSAPMGGVSPI